MNGILSLIVVAFILLIAYWWANQGLFSAILHCVCVIVAGALAFAFWEPVVIGYLLKGSSFDNYSWGMVLGLLFFLFLVILRVTSDLLIPFDIPLPSLPNTIGGAIVGLIAGVLTVGMASISCGLIQGPTEIIGFIGWGRHADSKGAPSKLNDLIIPAHNLTEKFYRNLSFGSCSPAGKSNLANNYPHLAETALSLHRDTFRNGDGRVAVAPKDLEINGYFFDPNYPTADGVAPGAYAIEFTVQTGAYDNGEQFVLGSSQARISTMENNPKVAYPTKFRQPLEGGEWKVYTFEDIGNYATSVPAEQTAKIVLIFPAAQFTDPSQIPKVFFIKGLRYILEKPQAIDLASRFASESGEVLVDNDNSSPDGGFLRNIQDFIAVQNSIKPVVLNVNLADSMSVVTGDSGNFLSGGKGIYKKGSSLQISRSQRISGFSHPEGTELLMLDASRRSNGIDMWGDRSKSFKDLGTDVALELVDSHGKGYKPVGHIWERQADVELSFDPSKPIQKISALPPQPSSGEHKLKLVFIVPVNTVIVGIRMGKTLIGTCELKAVNGRTD